MGVSGDAPAGLKVFQQTHQLNFDLLADYNGMIAKAFEVPMRDGGVIERTFLGKPVSLERGVTASRWTFIIGKDGLGINKGISISHSLFRCTCFPYTQKDTRKPFLRPGADFP